MKPNWQQLVVVGAGIAAAVYVMKRLAPNPGVLPMNGLGEGPTPYRPYQRMPGTYTTKGGPAYC